MLTRNEGEAIDLYDQSGQRIGSVVVTLIKSRDQVRLGFDFDRSITIMRREVPYTPPPAKECSP